MKSDEINEFLRQTFGTDVNGSVESGVCATCGKSVGNFRDTVSEKEYHISGMCQSCQDSVFGGGVETTYGITNEPLSDWVKEKLNNVPHLMHLLEWGGTFLAGGLLRTIINGEPFDYQHTDVDIFFRNGGVLEDVKAYLEKNKYFKKVYQCPEGKLSTYVYMVDGKETWKYQLISVDFYPDMETLLDSFDFTCIMVGTDGETFWYDERFVEDSEKKLLVWNKITYPAASLRRLMKYARKGYAMQEEQYQAFVEALWLHDYNIKDEKLVYVD